MGGGGAGATVEPAGIVSFPNGTRTHEQSINSGRSLRAHVERGSTVQAMALFSDDLFDVFEEAAEPSGTKGKKRARDAKEKTVEKVAKAKKAKSDDSAGEKEERGDGVAVVLRAETEEEEEADNSEVDVMEGVQESSEP